jgi:serine protease
VLVRYREGAFAPSLPVRAIRRSGERGALVSADARDEQATLDLVARLARDPAVEWAEPDRIRQRTSAVNANDPLFGAQWALHLAHLPDAWARSRGSASVVVAVLDTGIVPHPDLRGRYLPGYDFISSPASAGDGDGRDPDPTDAGTADPQSTAFHGSHVAGIIGADSDNELGIAGVDWSCQLLPVRVLGVSGGRGTDSDIADGIRWAAGA